ncbi:adaptin N terminal region-domain-containing protein [Amanita rubescens]|nr:adaptin N terminal region-domain-containing protein [Amanita rubescens]
MWERTLQDLIRGLRANKKDEAKFIARAVDEIRSEIRSDDMDLKAGAVMKLTYLEMLGYDVGWASFHIVEVMSSPKYHLKTVGYLAAAQTFQQDTDVLMLTTNLLKKDLSSSPADVAISLHGLSAIVTPDLARDLSPELVAMLNHSRPHIRKRAILAMYRVCEKQPQIIQNARPRLEEKLDDSDPGVIAATVNVLCELVRRDPKDYLTLAPRLFHLLTTSSNNWMLIKIVKIFGSLSPLEPRLVKKLQTPITELISTTPAISLLYECVHTCIIGGMLQGPNGDSLAKLCVSKLAAFIQDPDQNLKYIALLAMAKIAPSHPYLVAEYQDTILSSLSDQDISIRMRALDLVSAMVNRSNLQSIVQQVLSHLVPEASPRPSAAQSLSQNLSSSSTPSATIAPNQSAAYRLVLSQRILTMCSQNTYENINNFEWYLSVLVDLAHVANVDIGHEIRDQVLDVVGRVRAARPYAVKLMHGLLTDDSLILNANDEGSCSEVLWAAAWICGEYSEELPRPQDLISHLLRPEVTNLSPDIIAVCIQSAMKIFGYWAAELAQHWQNDCLPEVKSTVEHVMSRIQVFTESFHVEVQERAANILQLFRFIQADLNSHPPKTVLSRNVDLHFPKSLYLIQPLSTSYTLNPVAKAAQASVPIPDEDPIQDALAESTDRKKKSKKGKGKDISGEKKNSRKKRNGDDRKAERLEQLRDDPYYIIDDQPLKPTATDIDAIRVVKIEGMGSLLPPPPVKDSWLASLRSAAQTSSAHFVVDREGEMPEGASTRTRATSIRNCRGADDTQASAPEPIKVTRQKKKGTGKKRTSGIPPPS